MSRQQIISAMCELWGYTQRDFKNQTRDDIWTELHPFERVILTKYVRLEGVLNNPGA